MYLNKGFLDDAINAANWRITLDVFKSNTWETKTLKNHIEE